MIKKTRSVVTCLAAGLLMAIGCTGDAGRQGAPGPTGATGEPGPAGTPGAPGELDPNLSTWEKALAGVGGEQALTDLVGFEIQSSGARNLSDEGYAPGDSAVTVSTFNQTLSVDIANDALRVDWDRNIIFAGGIPLTYSEIINQDLGYVVGEDSFFGPALSTTDMPSSRWAAVRKQTMLLNPQLILKAVQENPSIASDGGVALHNGAIHELLVVEDSVYPITLWINASTGRVAKLWTMENDHLHRDVEIEVFFLDWLNDANGGAAFPMGVYLAIDGQLIHEEERSSVTINPAFDPTLFDFPAGAAPVYDDAMAVFGMTSHQWHQGFASLGLPLDVPQTYVQATELSTGVWFLGGGSHNSLAVEQAGGVVILEPPLYPERSEAVMAWVETQFPGKPITHVVITHHHHDHSAGARSYVAAGATIVLSENSASFFRNVFNAESTISPDVLATSQAPANMMLVPTGGSVTLSDATNSVVVHQFATVHANDMVLAHVPSGPYVFESDLWNPDPNGGAALAPVFAGNLLDGINSTGVYDPALTLVGGHGSWGPVSDLEAYVTP